MSPGLWVAQQRRIAAMPPQPLTPCDPRVASCPHRQRCARAWIDSDVDPVDASVCFRRGVDCAMFLDRRGLALLKVAA